MTRIGAFITASLLAGILSARDIPQAGTPVSVIVTVTGQKDAQPPQLTVDDVLVSENGRRMQVTGLEPIRSQSGLQLWMLIDDGSTTNLGRQLDDLKKFVLALPAATEIGIGYMRNGMVQKAQPLTSDHEAAAKSIRLPTGTPGISASPYLALTDLIKNPTYGPDNIITLMAATFYGCSETTFYVIAVYFGSVGVRKTRHAIPAGLVADTIGPIAAVIICRAVLG